MRRFSDYAASIALTVMIVLGATLAPAAAQAFRSEFTFVAFGFRVATTAFESRFGGDTYQISGTLRARGIARLFTTTSGALSATGTFANDRITNSDLDVRYVDDGKTKRTTIAVRSGRVATVTNDPELRKSDSWVETKAAELVGALDPIAATLVRARSLGEVCNRTVRVFDGAMRYNLEMSFLRVIPFSAGSFKSDAVTCRARFVPISGFSADRDEIEWARDELGIEISFAPVGASDLFAPVRALVDIGITEIRVTMRHYEQIAD